MPRPMDYPEFDKDYIEEDLDALEKWYAEDIENIKDPELRVKETEAAKKIREREKELDASLDAGEINHYQHWSKYEFEIGPQKVRLSTRTSLESQGLEYDMLGDVAEDWDILVADDQRLMRQKDELKSTIKSLFLVLIRPF